MGAGMPIEDMRGHFGFDENVLRCDYGSNYTAANSGQNSGNVTLQEVIFTVYKL